MRKCQSLVALVMEFAPTLEFNHAAMTMHFSSEANMQDFHSRPFPVRLALPHSATGDEPSLLIKLPSLGQK